MNDNLTISDRAVRTRLMRGLALAMTGREGKARSIAECERWKQALARSEADTVAARHITGVVLRSARGYLDQVERILGAEAPNGEPAGSPAARVR